MKLRNLTISVFLILNLAGCAAISESFRGLMGTSTQTLEKNRKAAITKSFNYDYFTCYTKVLDILKRGGSYVYAGDIKKHMIALYVSGEDTTPVGLFFNELDKDNTMIEVASPSTYGKEVIAAKVFTELEKLLRSQKSTLQPLSGNAAGVNITSPPEH